MREKFDPISYINEINSLVDPALTAYQNLLIQAGVPLEDVDRATYAVLAASTKGMRKARWFAQLVASVVEGEQKG